MALTKTPVCDFGKKAEDFKLKSINNELISLNDIKGEKATLVMFICNHCPYVKAIIKNLTKDCNDLKKEGINIFILPPSKIIGMVPIIIDLNNLSCRRYSSNFLGD